MTSPFGCTTHCWRWRLRRGRRRDQVRRNWISFALDLYVTSAFAHVTGGSQSVGGPRWTLQTNENVELIGKLRAANAARLVPRIGWQIGYQRWLSGNQTNYKFIHRMRRTRKRFRLDTARCRRQAAVAGLTWTANTTRQKTKWLEVGLMPGGDVLAC